MVKPLFLISNDDGVFAPGLDALAKGLEDLAEVWVVAPDRERSAVSHAISLHEPFRVKEVGPRRFGVSGTPADSVYYGLTEVVPRRPDLVLSGINYGHNLGDDIHYSGTIAAAKEACMLGLPALAVSKGGDLDWSHCVDLVRRILPRVLSMRMPARTFLSLNLPKNWQPESSLKVAVTGGMRYERTIVARTDPRGQDYVWIGGTRTKDDPQGNTDSDHNARGSATLTPLKLDLTDHDFLANLSEIFKT